MHAINYLNHVLTHSLTHQFDRSIYVVCWLLHVSSTRCDHCQTCNKTILLACQLKIIKVVLQRQHNN